MLISEKENTGNNLTNKWKRKQMSEEELATSRETRPEEKQ